MHPSTEGIYRVLPGRTEEEWLLLDVDSADPTYVERTVHDVMVGNRVEASLVWVDGEPQLERVVVLDSTRFRFLRTDEPIFQAAQSCFEEARAEGMGMNSRVTYGTDGEPNGALYCFAKQPGERDLFDEFQDGIKPLEPLIDKATDAIDPPVSVWVLEPREHFVVVYIVFDHEGVLEETMIETYG